MSTSWSRSFHFRVHPESTNGWARQRCGLYLVICVVCCLGLGEDLRAVFHARCGDVVGTRVGGFLRLRVVFCLFLHAVFLFTYFLYRLQPWIEVPRWTAFFLGRFYCRGVAKVRNRAPTLRQNVRKKALSPSAGKRFSTFATPLQ